MNDERFIQRVYRTTSVVGFVAALAFLAQWGIPASVSVIAGTLLGMGSLFSIEQGVRRFIYPGAKSHRPLVFFIVGTWPAIGFFIWLVARLHHFNLVAFLVGVILPNLVIVLKVFGQNVISSTEAPQGARRAGRDIPGPRKLSALRFPIKSSRPPAGPGGKAAPDRNV